MVVFRPIRLALPAGPKYSYTVTGGGGQRKIPGMDQHSSCILSGPLNLGIIFSFFSIFWCWGLMGIGAAAWNTELDQQQAAEPLICKEELWLPLYQRFTKAILCVDIKRCRRWCKYCITSRDLSSSEPSLTYQGNKQLSAYLCHRTQYLSGHFCLQKDIFFAFCSWSPAMSEYKQLIPMMMIGLIMGDAFTTLLFHLASGEAAQ